MRRETQRKRLFVPSNVEKIGITKIFLGEEIIGLKNEGHTKFINRLVPVTV